MDLNQLDIIYKRLSELEKRINIYLASIEMNELDFVLNGGYIFDEDLRCILDGSYTLEV